MIIFIFIIMDYNITPEQLDKLIKPFFDKEFKHAKWGEHDAIVMVVVHGMVL